MTEGIYNGVMKFFSLCVSLFLLYIVTVGEAVAALRPPVLKKGDACLLVSPDGSFPVAINIDAKLIPASTLKVFTALVGFHYLGVDYRFPTDVFLNAEGDLTIKGYGDPMSVSEELCGFAEQTAVALQEKPCSVRNIIIDDSYFETPLAIPGISDSLEPYDAPNGALSANFNTVAFKRSKTGEVVSAEPQTPLLPSLLGHIRSSGLTDGRIALPHDSVVVTRYWGELYLYFLACHGIKPSGPMRIEAQSASSGSRLFRFYAPDTFSQVVSNLLAFSNNFIANQILIAAGASAKGPPGTLKKGVDAAQEYALEVLHLPPLQIVEGSGISRMNRLSARTMYRILTAFKPYAPLMRKTEQEFYKTGTMDGIATRVGFIKGKHNTLFPFVILLNDSTPKMKAIQNYFYHLVKNYKEDSTK